MNEALLSSKKMDWITPQDFFDKLNEEFHFTLDTACSAQNAKCKNFYDEEKDGLAQSWATLGGGSMVQSALWQTDWQVG